jgi:ribonuclease HI
MLYIYIDGGVRNNQTPNKRQGYGSILVTTAEYPNHQAGLRVCKRFDFGNVTNNQAEYLVLLKALEYCIGEFEPDVYIFTDSQLVYKQINGEYDIKNPELLKIYRDIIRYKKLTRATIWNVPREQILTILGH